MHRAWRQPRISHGKKADLSLIFSLVENGMAAFRNEAPRTASKITAVGMDDFNVARLTGRPRPCLQRGINKSSAIAAMCQNCAPDSLQT